MSKTFYDVRILNIIIDLRIYNNLNCVDTRPLLVRVLVNYRLLKCSYIWLTLNCPLTTWLQSGYRQDQTCSTYRIRLNNLFFQHIILHIRVCMDTRMELKIIDLQLKYTVQGKGGIKAVWEIEWGICCALHSRRDTRQQEIKQQSWKGTWIWREWRDVWRVVSSFSMFWCGWWHREEKEWRR